MTDGSGEGSPAHRVLLITKTPVDEPRDGGALRVAAVRRLLEREGFEVDVFAVRDPGRPRLRGLPAPADVAAVARVVVRFARIGSATTTAWCSPGLVRTLAAARRRRRYDLALVEFSQLAAYLPVLPAPVLVDLHNIEAELLRNYARSARNRVRRLAARWESARLERLERRLPGLADGVCVVSRHDAELLGTWAPGGAPVVVATNGVDDAAFTAGVPRRDTVVFVAQLAWRPNVDAAVWLAREVWPLVRERAPGLRLQIIGRSPAAEVRALVGDDVEVHADVPDVLPWVAGARVATAPLLAAGGTRLKILEAMACGTPVVSTALGALGLEHLAGPGLRIESDARAFAAAVVEVAGSDADRAAIRSAVEPYRWDAALRPLADEVARLVRARAVAQPVNTSGRGGGAGPPR